MNMKLQTTLILALVLTVSCTPERKSKDKLTRVSNGAFRDGNNKISPEGQGRAQNGNPSSIDQEGNSPQTNSTQGEKAEDGSNENKSQASMNLCRVTNDSKLTDEQRQQPTCTGLEVEVDADGIIQVENKLHSLENVAPGAQFSAENTEIKEKSVVSTFISNSSEVNESKKNSALELPLLFTLMHTADEIESSDKDDSIQLKLNDALITDIEVSTDANKLKTVRILDSRIFDKLDVDYAITVEYKLK